MFDRFTDRARKIMGYARNEAKILNHQYIGTEHILLGIVEEGSGVAASALRNLHADSTVVRAAIAKVSQEGPTMVSMGQLPFTPRTKKVLELAGAAANKLKHNYIGTEHLLLGLVAEGGNVGVDALKELGITAEMVQHEIVEMMGATMETLGKDSPNPAGTESPEKPSLMVQSERAHFFDHYQAFTRTTAVYPGAGTGNYEAMTYVALKGAGECGEFAEKLGKLMRKQGSINAISRDNMDPETRLALAMELGDRLWYIAGAATELGYTLSEIAQINIEKLTSRKDRGVIIGEGDNR